MLEDFAWRASNRQLLSVQTATVGILLVAKALVALTAQRTKGRQFSHLRRVLKVVAQRCQPAGTRATWFGEIGTSRGMSAVVLLPVQK